jgi:hypothetical protein
MFQRMKVLGRLFRAKTSKASEGQRKVRNLKLHNYLSQAILLEWSKKLVQDERNMWQEEGKEIYLSGLKCDWIPWYSDNRCYRLHVIRMHVLNTGRMHTDMSKSKSSDKNLSQCLFARHNSHKKCVGLNQVISAGRRIGDIRNTWRILIEIYEGKNSLGSPKYR